MRIPAAEHSPMLSQSINYLLMRLTGDDGLVWWVQPAFLFWMDWIFFRSARLLGASKRLALVGTALMAIHFPFVDNATMTNNDLILASGMALSLYEMILTQRRLERGAAVAAGGLAMMLATKVIGVVYAGGGLVFSPFLLCGESGGDRPGTGDHRQSPRSVCAAVPGGRRLSVFHPALNLTLPDGLRL
jgi:hypothetical protein